MKTKPAKKARNAKPARNAEPKIHTDNAAPTASEIIAAARAILGSKPFPRDELIEASGSRSNPTPKKEIMHADFELEMLFREAAELWCKAERIARIFLEKGPTAASTLGHANDEKRTEEAAARPVSASFLLRYGTGDSNTKRAREKMAKLLGARQPKADPDTLVEEWLADWVGTPEGYHGLHLMLDHYRIQFEAQNREAKRASGSKPKPRRRRKKRRTGKKLLDR